MKRYESSAAWSGASQDYPANAKVVTEVPARSAEFVSDVLVPACQSLLTAVLVSSLLTFAAVRFWSFEGDRSVFWFGWTLALSTVFWCVLLRQHRKSLWASESVSGGEVLNNSAGAESKERLVFVNRQRSAEQTKEERQDDEWSAFCVDRDFRCPSASLSRRAG